MRARPPAQRVDTRSELIIVRRDRVASRRADCVVDLLAMGVAAVYYGVRDDETWVCRQSTVQVAERKS